MPYISICYIVDVARCWLMFDLIGVGGPSIAISDTSLVFPSDDNMCLFMMVLYLI